MPATTATITYYCAKSATDIAKLAVEYRKIQEISKLRTELERQKSISESLQSYTRLIRSDVQTLMHMYFKSAIENLNYALTAPGENQKEYLRQARNRFIDATTIEKNENLIFSYIGLALCQALTNDMDNSTKTINKIRNVYITLPDDIEELSLMMRYKKEWFTFLVHYFIERSISSFAWDRKESKEESFDYAFNKMYYKFDYAFNEMYFSNENKFDLKQDLKQYIKRLLNAFNTCGGFSMSEHENAENNKCAIKIILQEDFEAFKNEILLQFGIN
jgi:hypothetical protein